MRPKNILFISYWSLREPLNAAAVFPYLRLLSAREDVARIHLVTIESSTDPLPEVELDIPKVLHHAIYPRLKWSFFLSKMYLQLYAVQWLGKLVKREKIDLIFSKASMAGTIAHFVYMLTQVPYIVESFEPHSVYMLECGVWSRRDLRYLYANYMEGVILRHARHVITVTWNHQADLIAAGHSPDKIKVIPSITDIHAFRYQPDERRRIRDLLNIPMTSTVGIYVGKFGGLYYDHEAFTIFSQAFHHFKELHVLVLTPMDQQPLLDQAIKAGIPMDRFHLLMAPHVEVPSYLSAADFAFSTIKPSPIKCYQCPIKNGEYWANGLPILMTDGIADDHKLMRKGIGGSVFNADLSGLDEAFKTIGSILADPEHKAGMVRLAEKYKSLDIARKVYDELL